jgi:ABC-type polysaccharide/polyol phosphate export permease
MLAHLNPIAHFVAIVREPLMYNRIPYESWTIVLAINAAGLVAGAIVYVATRKHVAHWV